jgi:hypothetical protein
METIQFQVYKVKSKYIGVSLVLSVAMVVFGFVGILVYLFANEFKMFGLNTSSFVLLFFQGVFGLYISRKAVSDRKYFVSWNDSELSYFMPNNKEPVNIRLSDIWNIERESQKIRIELKTGEVKYFSFTYFYFPTRTTILEFFEGIKTKLEIEQKKVKVKSIN